MAQHVKSRGTAKRRSRAEWFVIFTAHRREGMTGTAIAQRYGLGHAFVYAVLNDPTGERERKRKNGYGGTCEDCGAHTDGSNGAAKAPTVCAACMAKRTHEERYWTPERIIDAIREFVAEHGRSPWADEWRRNGGEKHPVVSTVQREFGTWVNAIRVAGFECADAGRFERTEATRARMSAAQKKRRARERAARA